MNHRRFSGKFTGGTRNEAFCAKILDEQAGKIFHTITI